MTGTRWRRGGGGDGALAVPLFQTGRGPRRDRKWQGGFEGVRAMKEGGAGWVRLALWSCAEGGKVVGGGGMGWYGGPGPSCRPSSWAVAWISL